MTYSIALFASAAAFAFLEWHTDEDMVTLAVLVIAGCALGLLRPSRFIVTGLTLGLVVPALSLFSLASGSRPNYETYDQWAAHGVAHSASLCLLVIPALLAAFFGGAASRQASTHDRID